MASFLFFMFVKVTKFAFYSQEGWRHLSVLISYLNFFVNCLLVPIAVVLMSISWGDMATLKASLY